MKKLLVLCSVIIGFMILLSQAVNAEWVFTNGPWSYAGIYSLASNDSTVFIGSEYGIYCYSIDNSNWTKILSSPTIYNITVHGSIILANSNDSVFRSMDNGKTWSAFNTGLANRNTTCLAITDSFFYAGTDSGVFLARINDTKWTSSNSRFTEYVTSLAASDNIIYAYASTESGYYIYRSTNKGKNWDTVLATNLPINSLLIVKKSVLAGTYNLLSALSTQYYM